MKTYLRRWWILNRLYYFLKSKGGGVRWAKKRHFKLYVSGLKDQDKLWDEKGNMIEMPKPFIYRFPLSYISDTKNYDDLSIEIDNLIQECEDKKWIKTYIEKTTGEVFLNLDTMGRERYSVLSLLLGNEYSKPVFIAIIILLTSYFVSKIFGLS